MAGFHPILWLYILFQYVLNRLFSPQAPPPHAKLRRPRIAIIGAGITGISAAAHCVGHGFDVTIFEAGPPEDLGGIWSKVNNTSGLQIHSIMYRFFPSVHWKSDYPKREAIVEQVRKLWEAYHLDERTRFNSRVTSVTKDDKGSWIINQSHNDRYEGIIAAVGTCGDPKMPNIPGEERYKGEIFHSSKLNGKSAKDKTVIIIGGGASAVEGLEFAVNTGAAKTKVLSRSEKWIIPRNPIVDMLFAMNIFGRETFLSWVPENLLRLFFYRDLRDLAPPRKSGKGLFTGTPMVNSDIFNQIRSGKAEWLRGDILRFTKTGIRFNHRAQGVPKGGPGHTINVEGDMVIMATGYSRPALDFLPETCFQKEYLPPNWYLQVFPPDEPSICANNCTYVNAIGTVGNYHIGIYTRLLLVFLVDPLARPQPWLAKTWIKMTRFIKNRAPGGAFDFFTYAELIYWFIFCVVINPFRWKWAFFVFFGIGSALPMRVVEKENQVRNELNEVNGVRQHNGEKKQQTEASGTNGAKKSNSGGKPHEVNKGDGTRGSKGLSYAEAVMEETPNKNVENPANTGNPYEILNNPE
ncbi:MAG: hypothetical protein M1834_009578 [Cirrosporium novae-zelandiae]|nr:MAG: hypothetical protein M1834_009578 [Cirrosporium novae-zelandiae]